MVLSASFTDEDQPRESRKGPSAKRKRLHLLYLVHDTIHTTKSKLDDPTFAQSVEGALEDLFRQAAEYRNAPKHVKKLTSLLDIWEQRTFYSPDTIANLRKVVKEQTEGTTETKKEETKDAPLQAPKDVPFHLPSRHGDPDSLPFDLPAANLIPLITPNSSRPINPSMLRPLEFRAGPAEPEIVDAVKALLSDAAEIFGENVEGETAEVVDIDELGQHVVRDKETRETRICDSYYGWSEEFCRRMRRKLNGERDEERGRGRGRMGYDGSMSRSRSTEGSYSHDYGGRDSRSRSRSRSGRRDYSRGRYSLSPSRDRDPDPAFQGIPGLGFSR